MQTVDVHGRGREKPVTVNETIEAICEVAERGKIVLVFKGKDGAEARGNVPSDEAVEVILEALGATEMHTCRSTSGRRIYSVVALSDEPVHPCKLLVWALRASSDLLGNPEIPEKWKTSVLHAFLRDWRKKGHFKEE